MKSGYKQDLAYIHDSGFGALAENAGRFLIETLNDSGVDRGRVVELGCGGGITAAALLNAGFDVTGIDLSEALIETARTRVPDAEFYVGSFASMDIPPCVAVAAIGEVFNYTFDDIDIAQTDLFERIDAALAPGGVLVFDVAGPARAPSPGAGKTFVEGPDWTVLVDAEADTAATRLTRRITTFRRQGELYRRDREIHRLRLIDPSELTETLQRAGFTVQTFNAYDSLPLPNGLVGFMAKKPAGGNTGSFRW